VVEYIVAIDVTRVRFPADAFQLCGQQFGSPLNLFHVLPTNTHYMALFGLGCRLQVLETAPHRTAPHRTAPHRTAPHRTAPHRTAPHRTAPHCTALHCTALHCTAPHRTAPSASETPVADCCCSAPPRRDPLPQEMAGTFRSALLHSAALTPNCSASLNPFTPDVKPLGNTPVRGPRFLGPLQAPHQNPL
jgi:hypothetical protein